MKKIIVLLLFIASLKVCVAQNEFTKIKLDATVYKEGKTCLKKTGEPLNGNYAIRINRYQTNYEPFVNGLKNGEVKIFRNKRLVEKGIYRENLKEKTWLYYNEDGTISRRSFFENGLREGIDTSYYNGHVVKISSYSRNHLNGWTSNFIYSAPFELREKAFYVDDQKTKSIQYKNIDGLNFIVADSLCYNDKKQLKLKKSFVNDTLLLQFKFDYDIKIKDAYPIKTTKVDVFYGDKLDITYFFPNADENETEGRIEQLINYDFAYYTDVKKPKLLVSRLNQNSHFLSYTKTFYRKSPNGNLQSVFIKKAETILCQAGIIET